MALVCPWGECCVRCCGCSPYQTCPNTPCLGFRADNTIQHRERYPMSHHTNKLRLTERHWSSCQKRKRLSEITQLKWLFDDKLSHINTVILNKSPALIIISIQQLAMLSFWSGVIRRDFYSKLMLWSQTWSQGWWDIIASLVMFRHQFDVVYDSEADTCILPRKAWLWRGWVSCG